jgi:transketolase
MASGFGEVLLELAREDGRICGVSCDCWWFLAALAAEFPERAIEIGIAEQNLVSIGAGIAARGKIPFVLGMNPFVTMRCFEQIRTDLGYGARNVKVIGAYGTGLMYAGWGCTHHATEEIALMRLIPTMTVVMPCDAFETEHALRAAAATDGPFYIANCGATPLADPPEAQRTFTLGRASLLREGNAAAIFATGEIVPEALAAADQLSAEGVRVRVFSTHTVKPLDTEAVLTAARETPLIVTLEEHTVIGGLGGAVAEVLAESGASTPLVRIGVQDAFPVMNGERHHYRRALGLDGDSVASTIRTRLRA